MPDTPCETIHVAFASDTVMALPMAVAITSLLTTRAPTTRLAIHILSCGITGRARDQVTRTVARHGGGAAQLHWHDVSGAKAGLLQRLYTDSTRPYPPAAYARLLMGDLLPPEASRVIYLDIDMIVLRDLAALWREPMQDVALLAVQDLPHDSGHGDRLMQALSLADAQRFGITADYSYFQSGMLVIDLQALRNGGAAEVMRILSDYPALTFPDQDALNIVFGGVRRLVDPRWNQMSAVFWDAGAEGFPYAPETLRALREAPWIVHYSGPPKPWEKGCAHPFLSHWQAAHLLTPGAGKEGGSPAIYRVRNKWLRVRRVLGKRIRRALSRSA